MIKAAKIIFIIVILALASFYYLRLHTSLDFLHEIEIETDISQKNTSSREIQRFYFISNYSDTENPVRTLDKSGFIGRHSYRFRHVSDSANEPAVFLVMDFGGDDVHSIKCARSPGSLIAIANDFDVRCGIRDPRR